MYNIDDGDCNLVSCSFPSLYEERDEQRWKKWDCFFRILLDGRG